MSDLERRFHEAWLGMAQPIEGLVVSIPALLDAQCFQRHPPAEQARLVAHVGAKDPCIRDYPRFFSEVLGFKPEQFDEGAALPADLMLDVVEGHQTLRPTRALKRAEPAAPRSSEGLPDASTPTSRAGEAYSMLVWELPEGLHLDKKETVTGSWNYEPTAKLERLLRASRVGIGLLLNGPELRLLYAPHGESAGHLTFRLKDLVTTGGRPLLDALLMLLHARRFFGVLPEHALPAILELSRRRQAEVTNALAGQVLDALGILLGGIEGAADRDGWSVLKLALQRGDDHVYGGLLTVLLRLVFVLYAEDRGLLPVDTEPYGRDLSLKALYAQLVEDAGQYPDAMNRRFGAWPRLLALFRSIFFGASHGELKMPARRGQLFDPEAFPFLEGWTDGGAPVDALARSAMRVPSVDDGTVHRVLEKLVLLEGQRLSYQALDVEQIGSVYEALMGFQVKRLDSEGLCLKPNRVWVSAQELLAQEPSQRAKWLEEQCALEAKAVKGVGEPLKKAKDAEGVLEALDGLKQKGTERLGPGRLVLQPGAERRRTSSHYTPRSLSAPIVERALEPLLKAMGELPSSERLLNLKICDPAMGSGAFLVEACRFLADQVVAAWTREGVLKQAAKDEDILMRARRLVAQRCLYGVDRNPFAVNLAKLSLWLVTLAKNESFTFLDHALKAGDSLVGLDLEQLRSFNWKPGKQLEIGEKFLEKALAEALQHRVKILQMALDLEAPDRKHQLVLDPAKEKQELLRKADEALEQAKVIADLCVGAFFAAETDKARDAERLRRLDAISAWLARGGPPSPELIGMREELRAQVPAFHWMLEFPEVFHGKRPDPLAAEKVNKAAWMDAFVGNPPFMGKNGVGAIAPAYLPWLLMVHEGAHGNADYCAHFFRRVFHLLGEHGTFGLIATNTISQGDTRATGLQRLMADGAVIYDAVRSMKWPGGAANVAVSVVHGAKGRLATLGLEPRLDGRVVECINSRLRGKSERPDPRALAANEGKSFQGSTVLGMGFVVTPAKRSELVATNPRNGERIFRYVGGEEINSDPSPDLERYVINFGEVEETEARLWPDLYGLIEREVKPVRAKMSHSTARWFQFERPRSELYQAVRLLARCLANSQVSKHLVFAWRSPDVVFAHTTYAYPVETSRYLATLQSRVHEGWARLLSSSMRTDLRYAPSDCFETFPFPPEPAFTGLDAIGDKLDQVRGAYLSANSVGLTTTYNRLKNPSIADPAIVSLRALHEELDRQVLAAYGWSDIPVPPFCGATAAQFEAFGDEVIDRLFALNAERASAEALAAPKPAKKPRKPKGGVLPVRVRENSK